MKKLFTLIAALLFAATVWAQSSSPKMSYQAVVRNAANELVVNRTNLTVEVAIKQADTVAYKETHSNVKTNQNGLVSLLIGTGTVNKGSLNDVDWKNAIIATSIYLGSETVSAEVPVTAVPYALYAEEINSNSEIINNIYEKLYDTLNNYYTKTKINDTLANYYTQKEINDTLNNYYTKKEINDTLKSYLTITGLCDSIKSCDAIKDLNDTLDFYYTKEEINDTLNAYYDTTKINDTLKSYLTISGLCDSIKSCDAIKDLTDTLKYYYTKTDADKKFLTISGLCDSITNCDAIKDLNDTLDFYYTKEEINDTLSKYLTKKQINTKLKNYLTIDGLCDSIKNNCTDVALTSKANTFEKKNTFNKKVILNKSAVQADGSIDTGDSLVAVNAKDLINYTGKAIHDSITNNVSTMLSDSLENYLTIDGLCDSIKNKCGDFATKKYVDDAIDGLDIPDVTGMLTCGNVETECGKIAIRTAANTFTGKNTFSDTIDAKAGAVLVTSVVTNVGTIGTNDSLRAVNAKDLASYVDNAVAAKQVTLTIPSITVEDSTKLMNDTTLTIPAGFDTLDLSHLVQFYINGVYVGDTDDQVLTVNAATKKVHYDPAKNGNYELTLGDRIKIIYWVKKN